MDAVCILSQARSELSQSGPDLGFQFRAEPQSATERRLSRTSRSTRVLGGGGGAGAPGRPSRPRCAPSDRRVLTEPAPRRPLWAPGEQVEPIKHRGHKRGTCCFYGRARWSAEPALRQAGAGERAIGQSMSWAPGGR